MLSVITKVYPYLLARVPVIWVSSNFSFWASLICFPKIQWEVRSLTSYIPYFSAANHFRKRTLLPSDLEKLSVNPYVCRREGWRSRLSTLWRLPTLKHTCFLQGICVMLLSFITHSLPLWSIGIQVLFRLLLRTRQFLGEVNKIYQGPSSLLVLLAHPACSQEGDVMKYFP